MQRIHSSGCGAGAFFRSPGAGPGLFAAAVLAGWLFPAPQAQARRPEFCSDTAELQYAACRNEVREDLLTASAVCLNLSNGGERADCYEGAEEARDEGVAECAEQLDAREDLCDELGEQRYDPDVDPADFDADFTNLTNPNPYFPLVIGYHWDYAGGDESIAVEVLPETKQIEGITCIVVRDRVEQEGELVEDTDDWYGQALSGDVHYCGEIAQNYESFAGDDPPQPELVDVEGSWKAGREGAKFGILFPASPMVGDVYRQEWKPGDAEDVARVLSTTYSHGDDGDLDEFVPQALAETFCSDDCVVTEEFTPIEPDALERKYYAPGVGLFLEVDPESGDIVQLVGCSFDARCAMLPGP
jgi:hypothetical protein